MEKHKVLQKMNVLIYGIGNPGRQDDILGVACAEAIDSWGRNHGIRGLAVETGYQLNIEDAEIVSDKDLVIFTDASQADIEDIRLERVIPNANVDFSMHHVTPAFILNLCQSLYGKVPECYQLHIRGYSWEFMAEMTRQALQNLALAISYCQEIVLLRRKDSGRMNIAKSTKY